MLFAAMVAFGDAAGAVIPPEVAITYRWPGSILMNDGEVGSASLMISDSEIENIPDEIVDKIVKWDQGAMSSFGAVGYILP